MENLTFKTQAKGLGIRIIGGYILDDKISKSGIFIKNLMPGGLAEEDGRLMEGDQILEVNGDSFISITNNKAVLLLRQASATGTVKMKIQRDEISNEKYQDLIETYSFSSDSMDLPIFTDKPPQSSVVKLNKELIVHNQERSLSIDPRTYINVNKLKSSLKFLGFSPTPEQELEMKNKLTINVNGDVSYGEFVKVARAMFSKSTNSVELKSYSLPRMKHRNIERNDYYDLDLLYKENNNYKNQLQQKEKACLKFEKQITKLRKDLQAVLDSNKDLKTRLNLSEEAQRAARYTEEDYEVILRLMEAEIQRNQAIGQTDNNQNMMVTKEQIEYLRFRLKQTEINLNVHEVANEKLVQFVKFVQETLANRKQISLPSNTEFRVPLDDVLSSEADKTLFAVISLLHLQDNRINNGILKDGSIANLQINTQTERKYF